MKTCLPCGPDMNGGLQLADGVKHCCFMEEGPDNIDPNAPFQIPSVVIKSRPMRATQCYNVGDTLTDGSVNTKFYQMFGSVCYQSPGCLNFTEYGKCSLCDKGYFMGYNSLCIACTVGNCQICLADKQCSTCIPGTYMATNDGKTTADTDVIGGASICKACNNYCQCSGSFDSKLQALRLCDNCLSDAYWYKSDGAGTCTPC